MLRYSSPFLFLAGIPLLYYFSGPFSSLAVVAILLAALIGAEFIPPWRAPDPQLSARGFRLLPLLYVPLQLGVIVWATRVATLPSPAAFIALALSVGIVAGVFGMLCAHELAHSRSRFDRFVALAMLTGTSNRQFRISHIYGHHRWAGTMRDAATARLGESFYAFLIRTLPCPWREAWDFERRRCASRGSSWLGNRAVQDVAATVLVYAAVTASFGMRGALFFLCQSAIAIMVLELFNYIAHYGLLRGAHDDGQPEPLLDGCSWNASHAFSNLLIFNMGRHSDHHRRPTASYQILSGIGDTPELPLGYAGSILLALCPPLWRRVMDAEIFRLTSGQDPLSRGAAAAN
jgi:alkane 1-monooxygenase